MPSEKLNLTETICAATKPEIKEYALKDTGQKGLLLRVQPGGSKSWIVRTRHNRKQVKRTLGIYPDTSLKEARKRAAFIAAEGRQLKDLSHDRTQTFKAFQHRHAMQQAIRYKPLGRDAYDAYVRSQLLPAFGHLKLHQIDAPSINAWMTRYSKNAPGGANRAFDILRAMFNCAYDWGLLPANHPNPCKAVRKNKRKAVGTFLTKEQYIRLGQTLQRHEDTDMSARIIKFLMLTGCRVGEVINLEWADVKAKNLSPNHLSLRDSKTGARSLPIGQEAVDYLGQQRARRAVDDPARPKGDRRAQFVFPLPESKRPSETVRAHWNTIKAEADLPKKLRLHDLRHSFASFGLEQGKSLFMIQKLLGHKRIETTERYAHLNNDTLAQAAEKVGGWIMEAVSGD